MNEHTRHFFRLDNDERHRLSRRSISYARNWKRYEACEPVEAAGLEFRCNLNVIGILENARKELKTQ